jgi:hypothetical protein
MVARMAMRVVMPAVRMASSCHHARTIRGLDGSVARHAGGHLTGRQCVQPSGSAFAFASVNPALTHAAAQTLPGTSHA